MLTHAQTDRYVRRLELERSASLDELQRAHLVAVAFENLAIHLDEPVTLEIDELFRKVVESGRGGFCYELNGLFAELLEALGFTVSRLAARVWNDDGTLGIPFDHLVLLVDGGGDAHGWLVDVGFGDNFVSPLPLVVDVDHRDEAGTFRLVAAPDGDLDLLRDGQREYRIDLTPRRLTDFEPGRKHHTTSPDSHFTQGSVCSRMLPHGGRVTISGRRLTSTTATGDRDVRELDDDALMRAYRDLFDIALDRLPPR